MPPPLSHRRRNLRDWISIAEVTKIPRLSARSAATSTGLRIFKLVKEIPALSMLWWDVHDSGRVHIRCVAHNLRLLENRRGAGMDDSELSHPIFSNLNPRRLGMSWLSFSAFGQNGIS